MKKTRIIFCSDMHLCHKDWYGRSPKERIDNLIQNLNEFYDKNPYEKIIFLGDYSLDHWGTKEGGSWLHEGVSNTANFKRDYASRLKAPYYMCPGNHEQYGYEHWLEIVGTPRDDAFTVGGYLIITCDNYAGILEPTEPSDCLYSVTKIDFIKEKMAEHPCLPVILCGHYFDWNKEPPEFLEFLKNENRITLIVCGHDHRTEITDLGERAGNLCIYHDGHYSFSGDSKTPYDVMWGFTECYLTELGIEMRYIEPENTINYKNTVLEHKFRTQNRAFFRRRDK